MNGRSKRIGQWMWTLIVAIAIFYGGQFIEDMANQPEKQALTVYAPADMEDAFVSALGQSSLSQTHKIVMTNDPNANICVEYAKQDDSSYQKLAYSPFVVAYSNNNDAFKKLKKAEVCIPSEYY